jgi:hypothetical protein
VTTGQQETAQRTGQRNAMTDNHRGYNPYAPNRANQRGNRNGYGVVYGYPYYPFSYGWNPGWYGTGYGSYYNNYPGSTGYNFDSDNGSYSQPTETAPAPQAVVPTAKPDSAVAARAVVDNAVDKSPALIAANGSVNQAQSMYTEARERAIAALREKPEYKAAVARRHAAAGDVRAAKGGDATPATGQPSSAVVAAATAKLEAGDEVTRMEEQAVAADPAASAAKARLDQATADRDTLKAQLTSQVQQSVH